MTYHVGLVGFGLSGEVFHAPLIERVEGLELTAIVSSQKERILQKYPHVRVVPDMKSLLVDRQIDVVVIATPNALHYPLAKEALLAGKHVVVEKPFTITTAEADELIALAKRQKVVLTVYHNRRWDGDFLTVKRLLESGVLGRVTLFESHFDRYRPQVRVRWREQEGPGAGSLYDLGSHLLDQSLLLFGQPEAVWADLRKERPGAEAIDSFHLVLQYPQMRAVLRAGSLVREETPRLLVHGEKGSFVKYGYDNQEMQLRQGMKPGDAGWGMDPPDRYGLIHTEIGGLVMRGKVETLPGCYETFYEKLEHSLREGEAPPVLPEEARKVMALIEAAMTSQREGAWVRLQ